MPKDNYCIRILADLNQINACKKTIDDTSGATQKLARVFNLAGNLVRLRILLLLHREDELCVCDLSDILEMKVPAVSQHLRKLKDGGIIQNRKEGQTIFYSMVTDYDKMLRPFFMMLEEDKIPSSVV